MQGVVNGLFYCNQERTQELSNRMYMRNTTTAPIKKNMAKMEQKDSILGV